MSRRALLSGAVALAAGLMLSAGVAAAADITVGVLVPTTGSQATDGKDMSNAVQLAADQINAKGGVLGSKIALSVQDDACDPQQAVSAASKLVSQNVSGVVGGYCSGATLPTLKVFGDAGIPFVITAANSTKLVDADPGNAFLINSTGDDQVKTAVDLLKAKNVKKLVVVDEGDAYSADLAKITNDLFPKSGGQVASTEVVNKGEQDFSALVTKVKSEKPDAVFWTAYYDDGALLIKQLRQAGYRGMILIGDGSNSPKVFEIAGKAAEGVYLLTNPTVDELPNAKTFAADYKKKFNVEPGPYSALTYDGMDLLADAIKRAGAPDKAKIIAALKGTKSFEGIAGPVNFTPKNTLNRSNFVVLIGKGGKWTLYKSAS
jgi:branched-chain amino acid transport system substrate-binding protein